MDNVCGLDALLFRLPHTGNCASFAYVFLAAPTRANSGINTPVTSSCASEWLDDFSNDTMRKLLEPASALEPHALVIYRNIAENSKGYGQWMRNMISMLRKAAIPLRFASTAGAREALVPQSTTRAVFLQDVEEDQYAASVPSCATWRYRLAYR